MFANHEEFPSPLFPGRKWRVQEGATLIAEAELIRVLENEKG
jgi:hypothetical protein